MPRFLAFDIGTSAGRAILGTLHEDKLTLDFVHRFPNRAVPVRGILYWDILHLWHGMLDGLQSWIHNDLDLDGIGLDTWAVDFALLDESGGTGTGNVRQLGVRRRARPTGRSSQAAAIKHSAR